MKVLFINGPSQDVCDRFFGWPTSLLYAIAPSVAEMDADRLNLEYDHALFDPIWYVPEVNGDEVRTQLLDRLKDVSVLCASATYDALHPTLDLFRVAKRLNPSITTILGGPHLDEVHRLRHYNNSRQNAGIVDFVVAGDGEYALLALLRAIGDGGIGHLRPETIPGKAWIYHSGGVATSNGAPIILDHLPFMPLEIADQNRHRLDFDVFTDATGNILPTAQMIAKRGCGYDCVFCSERRSIAYPNARSIDNILAEIDRRKMQGFKAIFFDDSTFGLFPRVEELLEELAGTGMRFGCLNRFNHLMDSNLVARYKSAGFDYFYCSIEQFDDAALSAMKKGQDTRKIQSSMQLLRDHGIRLGVSLLYGLPFESDQSIRATIDYVGDWVDAGLIRLVSESVLSFHPGTPAGKHLKESFDRTPPNRGRPFDHFEEGQWYHESHVTADYLDRIFGWSEERFGPVMIRNRHSWYARSGLLRLADDDKQGVGFRQPADEMNVVS